MNKKNLLLCFMIASIFILSGCGAKINQTLKLDSNFMGERIIEVELGSEELAEITGGEPALTKVIQESKPDLLELAVENISETSVKYTFRYAFQNIDEYLSKSEQIAGIPSNTTFSHNVDIENPFKSQIDFYEDSIKKELVQWAIDAVVESGITTASTSNFIASNNMSIEINEESYFQYANTQTHKISQKIEVPIEQLEMRMNLDTEQFNISFYIENKYKTLVDFDRIQAYLETKSPTSKSEADDLTVYDMSFNDPLSFKTHLETSEVGTLNLLKTLDNPLNIHYQFTTVANLSDSIDRLTKINNYTVRVEKANAFDSPYATVKSNSDVISSDTDYIEYGGNNGYFDFSYDYSRQLVAESITVKRTVDSLDAVTNTIEISVDTQELAAYDLDKIVSYFEGIDFKATVEEKGVMTQINLTETIKLNESRSNLMGLQSFYTTLNKDVFNDSYVHFISDYDYSKLLTAKLYHSETKIDKDFKLSSVFFNGSSYNPAALEQFIIGNYYEFEGDATAFEFVVIQKSMVGILIIGGVVLLILGVSAYFLAKKRPWQKSIKAVAGDA